MILREDEQAKLNIKTQKVEVYQALLSYFDNHKVEGYSSNLFTRQVLEKLLNVLDNNIYVTQESNDIADMVVQHWIDLLSTDEAKWKEKIEKCLRTAEIAEAELIAQLAKEKLEYLKEESK